MYLIQAPEEQFGKYPTGNIYGIEFVNGLALIHTEYHYRFYKRLGFKDVTPAWIRDIDSPLDGEDKQLLAIRWGGLGDNLLITPALRGLKKKYPKLKITFAGKHPANEILANHPLIDLYYSRMKHNIANFIGQYDQAIDFTHTIECNPESEYKDAKEIACEFAKVTPSDMRPIMGLTQAEILKGKDILAKHGIKKGDKIIFFQVEATAAIRTLPIKFVLGLSNKLAKDGCKVILNGVNSIGLTDAVYIRCKKCKKEYLFITKSNKVTLNCKKCRTKTTVVKNPNIIDLINKLKIREMAAIVKLSDLVISPDTGAVHIAQACQVPCIGLYSSFDANTRTKYYTDLYVVQLPYHCAPCFQHGYDCHRKDKQGVSECMSQFQKPKNINKVYKIAKHILNKGMIEHREPFIRNPKLTFQCPICFSRKHKLFGRKGYLFYIRCLNCNNLHTDVIEKVGYLDKKYYDKCYKEKWYRKGQKRIANYINKYLRDLGFKDINALEIGSALGDLLLQLKKHGAQVTGVEISKYAAERTKKLFTTFNSDWESFENRWEDKFNLVILHHTIEHFRDIHKAMLKVSRVLVKGGLVYVGAPDGDQIVDNKNIHVNTYYPGEHVNLFGEKALKILADKTGFEVVEFNRSKYNFTAWLRKM